MMWRSISFRKIKRFATSEIPEWSHRIQWQKEMNQTHEDHTQEAKIRSTESTSILTVFIFFLSCIIQTDEFWLRWCVLISLAGLYFSNTVFTFHLATGVVLVEFVAFFFIFFVASFSQQYWISILWVLHWNVLFWLHQCF